MRPPIGGRNCVAPLSCVSAIRFLFRMPQPLPSTSSEFDVDASTRESIRLTAGLAIGAVAAASSLGMLLGFGRRTSTLWRPLNAAAHMALGLRADDVWGFQSDVTLVGVAVVLVVSTVAGVVIAELTSSPRFSSNTLAAFGVALVGYFLHVHIVARKPGGLTALLTLGELRALYAAAAIALLLGMRYAFPTSAGAPPN
jgi:hypothetical protein